MGRFLLNRSPRLGQQSAFVCRFPQRKIRIGRLYSRPSNRKGSIPNQPRETTLPPCELKFLVDTKAAAQKVVANDCPARHSRCQQSKANTAVWIGRETPFRIVATAAFLPKSVHSESELTSPGGKQAAMERRSARTHSLGPTPRDRCD